MNSPRIYQSISSIALIALIVLCILWELWLAPLRPGGSMLVLKALPLLLPLFGILHGRRYTYQWTSMLILAYRAEGLVRATSDPGISRHVAVVEVVLATVLFITTVAYSKITGQPKHPPAD